MRRCQPSEPPEVVIEHRLRAYTLGIAASAGVLVLATVATAQDPKDRREAEQRYIEASVELGCNAIEFASATEEATREARNEATLKRFGFTRTSYGAAMVEFGARGGVEAQITRGIRKCTTTSAGPARDGAYSGKFKTKSGEGSLRMDVRSRTVRGYCHAKLAKNTVKVRFSGKISGGHVRATGRGRGRSSSSFTYLIRGQITKGRFRGTVTLAFDGGEIFEAPVSIPRQ